MKPRQSPAPNSKHDTETFNPFNLATFPRNDENEPNDSVTEHRRAHVSHYYCRGQHESANTGELQPSRNNNKNKFKSHDLGLAGTDRA